MAKGLLFSKTSVSMLQKETKIVTFQVNQQMAISMHGFVSWSFSLDDNTLSNDTLSSGEGQNQIQEHGRRKPNWREGRTLYPMPLVLPQDLFLCLFICNVGHPGWEQPSFFVILEVPKNPWKLASFKTEISWAFWVDAWTWGNLS